MPELEEHEALPCANVLVATTMALMTTWADSALEPDGGPCRHCTHLARKIVANLFTLQHHPGVDPQLRQVLATLHQRWVEITRGAMKQQRIEVSTLPCRPGTLH